MTYAASKRLADNLQAKPARLTPAQYRTMETLLNTGKVYLADNFNGRVDPRSETLRSTADQLKDLGYIEWVAFRNRTMMRLGYYTLTEAGMARGLTLSDSESSASRQHRIETGRYLKYADRPEFAPPAPFKVDDLVQRKGRPGTCKYRVDKVVLTVDNTYFYEVTDTCKHHDVDDSPSTIGAWFDNVVLSPTEYEVVGNTDDARSVTDHIAKHGNPFPVGAYVRRKSTLLSTSVQRVKAVKMDESTFSGWFYTLVDADGDTVETVLNHDAWSQVEVTVRQVWEVKP